MKIKIPIWLKHLLVVGALVMVFYPTAKSYLFSSTPTGGDLSNAITYVENLRQDFNLPPTSWQSFWYSGIPTFRSYAWMHFYLMQPLAHFLDSYWALEIYSISTLFLFFLFSYFLVYYLSGSVTFGFLSTLILFYSRGTVLALLKSGFIAATNTQFFLPLSLLLTLLYIDKRDKRFLILAATFAGLAVLGHPMVGLFFVVLPGAIVLLFGSHLHSFWQRCKNIFGFSLMVIFMAGMIIYPQLEFFTTTSESRVCANCTWDLTMLYSLFNPAAFLVFFLLLVAGIPVLLLGKERRNLSLFLAFLAVLIIVLVMFVSVTFNLNLIPLIGSTLWPERAVWVILVTMACLSAVLMNQIVGRFKSRPVLNIALSVVFISLSVALFLTQPRNMYLVLKAPVGIFPPDRALLLGKYKQIEPATLVPTWLNTADTNHRFDDLNYEVNHWWNTVYAIPNTRGYAQFTKGILNDWYAWFWAAETDNLKIEDKIVAKNNALFLLDWFAVSYLGKEETGAIPGRNGYANFLLTPEVINDQESKFNLTFMKLKPEIISPIVLATNAPSMLVVGERTSFDDVTRALAITNMNSGTIIPIMGPDKLEDLNKIDLKDFDILYLVGYKDEKDSFAWKLVEDYVREGGKVLVDTGVEVRESNSKSLPSIFPILETQRGGLGQEWQTQPSTHPVVNEVEINNFAPLVYGQNTWKLSYAPSVNRLNKGASVILAQNEKPVLVEHSPGKGKVIWSGLNLAYHAKNANNLQEGKLLSNILTYLTGATGQPVAQKTERVSPEKARVAGDNFKGVLFKESYDRGWQAKVNTPTATGWKNIPIYRAGPDFMYARLPQKSTRAVVEFNFRGSALAWILFLLGLGTLVYAVLNLIMNPQTNFKFNPGQIIRQKFKGWWGNEEE